MNMLEMELFIALKGHGDHSTAVLLALDVAAKLPPVYAAAPDLLKAAEMALTFGRNTTYFNEANYNQSKEVRAELVKAIAKAKGEAE